MSSAGSGRKPINRPANLFLIRLEVKKLTSDVLSEILTKYKTVAIVGLSRDPSKDSYKVAEYLKNHGFRIVPVNPSADEVKFGLFLVLFSPLLFSAKPRMAWL